MKPTLNTNHTLAPPSTILLREHSLLKMKLDNYFSSSIEEKEWLAFGEKINQILFNNNQSLKHQ